MISKPYLFHISVWYRDLGPKLGTKGAQTLLFYLVTTLACIYATVCTKADVVGSPGNPTPHNEVLLPMPLHGCLNSLI